MKNFCYFLLIVFVFTLITFSKGYAEVGSTVLAFDFNGNLILTTIDKKATTAITYKTVGWTIFNATRTKSVVVPFEAYKSENLPEGNVKTYFKTDADVILSRIGSVDRAWQKDLYTNGGDLYLDSVMTILDHGKILGGLTDDGRKNWGEIYFTLSGIQGARGWKYPEGLSSHFNKLVHLPPHPEMLEGSVTVKHFEMDGTPLSQYDYFEYLIRDMTYTYPPTSVIGRGYKGYKVGYDALPSGTMNTSTANISMKYDGAFTDATIYFFYDDVIASTTNTNLNPNLSGFIKADTRGSEKFDVTKGIPTSEKLYVKVFSKNYLYNYNFIENTGFKNYTVTVQKTYNLSWTEDRGKYVWVTWTDSSGVVHRDREWNENWVTVTASPTVSKDYTIPREYSYWTIPLLEVYGIDKAVVNNAALPSGTLTLTPQGYTFPNMDVWNSTIVSDHVKYPSVPDAFTITLPSESITGGGSRPSVPDEDWSMNADGAVDQIQVKNDKLVFNGTVVMSDSEVSKNTPDPDTIPVNQNIGPNVLYQSDLKIDSLLKNLVYPSTGSVHYKLSEKSITIKTDGIIQTLNVNSVKVHTPVVCNASIWNDQTYNQELTPDDTKASVILDKATKIQFLTSGKHLNIPGYSEREYEAYTKEKQVLFPFDVYMDTNLKENSKYLKANTWYSVPLSKDTLDIFVPSWVDEGDYTVQFRTISINADAADLTKTQDKANLDFTKYVAVKNIPVRVIGRVFGFKVTDISDSIWNKFFRTSDNTTNHSANYFWVGTNNENGTSIGVNPKHTLPILTGSNSFFKNIGALKTGYKFKFELQTIGNYFEEFDGISITPSFYYVSNTGTNTQPVDLYYNERFNNLDNYFVKIENGTTSRNRQNTKYTKLGDPYRNVPLAEIAETSRILGLNKNAFENQETKIGWLDWLFLSKGLRTFIGDPTSLPSTVDADRVIKSKQKWYGEYYIPNTVYACRKGTDVAEYARSNNGLDDKSAIWLKKGYIVVNFDITTIKSKDFANPVLSYYTSPNANMWQIEGYENLKVDSNGIKFTLNDGDTIFYYTDKKASDDYQEGGTH